ncbi:MAG: adenylyl-sulfate kinase [Candidatus Omnitrophica bacterium]|nr:adenylyl-sulfate kinase [Candidatus Omnitrophota bacterium]
MVIWLIGLSGAGKTAIGKEMVKLWKKEESNTVLVDGDEMRGIFQLDRGEKDYSIESRKLNADRICQICLWLDKQGINVVCSILSLFESSREWNRENYSSYFEVFISVPMEKLIERDQKNLYKPALESKTKNVVGVDIPFTPPAKPDLVLDNSRDQTDMSVFANEIFEKAKQYR